MKTITLKRKITFEIPEGTNLKELVDSFNRAVRIWGVVKGFNPVGQGSLEFSIKEPRTKKAKKAA